VTEVIRYAIGDATAPSERPAIIAHICNTVGGWGAGFVVALSRRWSEPERTYRERHRAVGSVLGTVQVVEVEPGLWVANMVAQHGIGHGWGRRPPIRYDALRQCLEQVAGTARDLGATIVGPRFGAGLAGGDWAQVEAIIEETCAEVPVTIYDLPDPLTP